MSNELLADATLSHYRIVSKLGAGGMGEVWLAEDTRLDRKVALKLLPAEFTQDSERLRRFTQEAKAASALNHPNIISVYDIGECETGRFIVMELVSGRTLRSVIASDNSLETFFALGRQMARALSAAHAAGITHRDIKPDNIMVRDDGYVKVLDFGLARLLPTTSSDPEAQTLAQQTTPGTVMGTLAYMSPEQASGHNVGSPSDIFALGIVLYELATGRHPFKSETMIGYLHAITSQVPPSMTSLKSHLPVALDDLILRMLEKDADSRPTAAEVAQALQEIEKYGSSNTLPFRVVADKPKGTRQEEGFWVAVLPFKYRGTNTDIEALAEGLSEDILTGLSRFFYLRVIARSSTLRFTSEGGDVRTVGKQLGARYVMEGSLRVAGSLLRVSVQLVDASSGAHLWAKTYDRPFRSDEIFAVQDDLVPRIVSTVADAYGVLPRSMSQAVRSKDPNELTPYEALLRSFSYVERVSIEEHTAAKAALERAVEQAPGDANCWSMLSILLTDEYIHGFNPQPDSLDRAQQAARRAVDADTSNHRSYQALAWALYFRKEFQASRVAAEHAISLNPMDASNTAYMGQTIAFGGEWERGCSLITGAMQLNPSHPGWYWYAPFLDAYRKGDYRDALAIALKINMPGLSLGFVALASAYGQLGEFAAGRAAIRELLALRPDFAAYARGELRKIWDAELVEHLIAGLRKAGLEISDEAPASTSSVPSFASSETRAAEGFWVAVLPFKSSGTAAELNALAEGLSEDIVMGLSRFSYLHVIARGSTLRYANQTTDLRTVGKELGARYVMEGSLRQAGTKLRLAVQLVDATTGAHLWAENYEREFSPENIFELQDDLVPHIVSTVADWYGALPHSMSEIVRLKPPDQLSPYEALLRSFGYFENIAPQEHAIVRSSLERAVEQEPANADLWAMLSMLFGEEHRFGFNVEPDSLGRSLEAARKAVAIAHANHFAWLALAQALYFRKEFDPFLDAAERAIELNPMDGSTVEYLGHLIAFSGNWERGCELAERARHLNPNHPSWYWAVPFLDAYRKGDYRTARPILTKGNPQKNYLIHALIAAVNGQLGESEAAATHLQEVLTMMPDFPSIGRSEFSKWYLPELVDHLMEGLRKAGLETNDEVQLSKSSPSFASNETRADEGFWVAVLPFQFAGPAELSALAEGLSEEIVRGLSRFSYLRVIARSSTLRFASESPDVRTVGKTLGARYVIEGSVRQAGAAVRVSVQLVDASSGAHLWAETYDRSFKAEEIFALQDDLVPRIVSTVADQHGVLPHSMSEDLRTRDPGDLTPYETVLRGFRYYEGVTAAEHVALRSTLERATERGPANADCWAMLSIMYCDEHKFGFNPLPDSLGRARAAAQRAVEISPANPFAYEALAQALFFRKEFDSFRNAAERAITLNPMDGATNAFMGILMAFTGDWDYGCAVAERATQLNPHHPGWYWNAAFYNAYRKFDYEGALKITLEFNMPGLFYHHVNRAAVYGQLGEREAASKALEELLALKPDFANTGRTELGKWLRPEFVEQVIDGLRKAGLETGDGETGRDGDERDVAPSPTHPVSLSQSHSSGSLIKSIAVLPFQNLSVDPEQEFFADGITEEILNALSQIKDLRVAGRSSSFSFKGRNEDLRSVGAKLNVTTILEGTLRRSGDRLRITTQLIDAVSGYQLWSERYDRVLEDIFDIQDEIALAVVDALKLKLFGDAKEAVVKRYTDDAEVHELFLKGRYYSYKYTAEGWTRAVEFFEKVIEQHPGHAPAHAGKAAALGCLWFFGLSPADQIVPSFRSAATKAIELDGNLAGAHLSLGMVNFFHDWEWEKAEQEFKQAILLNPKDAEALSYYAMFLAFVDRFDEAMALARRALEVDPLSLLINMNVGWTYFSAGLANEAFDQTRKMTEIEPGFFGAYWLRGATYLGNGDYEEAIEQLTKAVSLGGYPIVLADLGAAYALAGKKETAETILDQLLDMRRQSYVPAICLARVYSRLGELEKTIHWLETAYEERNGELVFLESEITSAAQGDSLNSLGKDPRVKTLLERMKLPSRDRGE